MNKGVSVVICCYNSAARLPETLEHLTKQRVSDKIKWEVVVVDNNSTDETAQVAQRLWDSYLTTIPLTIVNEPQQGLIHARMTGIRAATYEYLIFCDDDNWLCTNYVTDSFRILESNDRIGACGGQGAPVFGGNKPDFFDGCVHGYALGPQGRNEGEVMGSTLYGAGLVVRRSVILRVLDSGFQTKLSGRSGKTLSAGDDGELTTLIKILGYQLWYSPYLEFEHYLPEGRLQWSYITRMFQQFGKGNGVLQPYYALAEQTNSRSWTYHFFRRVYYTLRRLTAPRSVREKYIVLLMDATMLTTMVSQRKHFSSTMQDLLRVKKNFTALTPQPILNRS
ncbi:glycosyltransferase [Spirosoma agri]|uniref:Glycosyltransferase family 2 protein n=1 Tax=Spirosoma agri TaxID=1987381 RepID=A0A6M0IN43_9BACT|nr:glycosyltransferase [Spirosoma agri]NEU69332.1 glycosyltransferase family 2 protein [Spirosoma agri]